MRSNRNWRSSVQAPTPGLRYAGWERANPSQMVAQVGGIVSVNPDSSSQKDVEVPTFEPGTEPKTKSRYDGVSCKSMAHEAGTR